MKDDRRHSQKRVMKYREFHDLKMTNSMTMTCTHDGFDLLLQRHLLCFLSISPRISFYRCFALSHSVTVLLMVNDSHQVIEWFRELHLHIRKDVASISVHCYFPLSFSPSLYFSLSSLPFFYLTCCLVLIRFAPSFSPSNPLFSHASYTAAWLVEHSCWNIT